MPSFAMKVYDLQWFTTFGMGYAAAAQALVDDGIDTVLTQNRIDPLPQSGVDQTGYLAAYRDRLAAYDDDAWLDALHRHGLRVLETSAVLFDPAALERFPDARPVDARGVPDSGIDWYVGVCPTHDAYLDWKIDRLRRVAAELRPDGLFLQFMRYPGFWENWTWDPAYAFSAADRFCFCDRCRARFAASRRIDLPNGPVAALAEAMLDRHGEEWHRWRGEQIAGIIGRVKQAVTDDGNPQAIVLNTLPFPASDFGGRDVRYEFAAQHLPSLAPLVDRFELMTYLQILKRPVTWLAAAVRDAKEQLPPDASVVCTLQVAPLYTAGIHAPRRRASEVTAADLDAAARTALDAGADGLVFYHWTDFLEDDAAGGDKRRVLRAVTHG